MSDEFVLPHSPLVHYRGILSGVALNAIALMIHSPLLSNFNALSGTIVLLGGTFDPVHTGHLRMAEVVLRHTPEATAVVFIPAKRNPLKSQTPVASDAQRLEMLRLAIAEIPQRFVSPIELTRNGASYTIDTLRQIRSEHGDQGALVLVIGADQLGDLHRWRSVEDIFILATVKVLGREGITAADVPMLSSSLSPSIQAQLQANFIPFAEPISATFIREQLRAGNIAAVLGQLSPKVVEFIQREGLYR